jgi:hypothetical protein
MQTLSDVTEIFRLPAPAPKPLGVAFAGTALWTASREAHRLYAIDPASWTARDEGEMPGTPFGMTVVGDELRIVIGMGENDDRYIYRFVPGHGFKSDRIACPDFTGSHLAFDGDVLFLSQAQHRTILSLDAKGAVIRTIALERVPIGMTIVQGSFFLVTSDEEFEDVQLTKVDARGTAPSITAVARIPFAARGLTFDGTRFWTSHRDNNEIVAFTYSPLL